MLPCRLREIFPLLNVLNFFLWLISMNLFIEIELIECAAVRIPDINAFYGCQRMELSGIMFHYFRILISTWFFRWFQNVNWLLIDSSNETNCLCSKRFNNFPLFPNRKHSHNWQYKYLFHWHRTCWFVPLIFALNSKLSTKRKILQKKSKKSLTSICWLRKLTLDIGNDAMCTD